MSLSPRQSEQHHQQTCVFSPLTSSSTPSTSSSEGYSCVTMFLWRRMLLLLTALTAATFFLSASENPRSFPAKAAVAIRRQATAYALPSGTIEETNVAMATPPQKRGEVLDFGNSHWCPNSQCQNSNICHPCRRRWLIILATGRSASTTLLYMLGSLPNVRLSGENNDQLKVMKRAVDNIRLKENFIANTNDNTSPWGHNAVPEGAYSCVVQTMMETINPPGEKVANSNDDANTIIGFKTVRFLENVERDEELQPLAEYLKESFPCARFIVNIRSDTESQAESWGKSFHGDKEDSLHQIADLNRRMGLLAELLGSDSAYFLDSTDWINDVKHLNLVVNWLGFSKSCAFDELLEFNTGGPYGYSNGRTDAHHNPDCHYLG